MTDNRPHSLSEEFQLTKDEQRARNLTLLNVYATDEEIAKVFTNPKVLLGSTILILIGTAVMWCLETTPIVQLP
jgi:hypothetical protein